MSIAFGKYLIAQRERLGLNQTELAAAIGVTSGAVCTWEKGVRIPRPAQLIALQRLFDVQILDELASRLSDG